MRKLWTILVAPALVICVGCSDVVGTASSSADSNPIPPRRVLSPGEIRLDDHLPCVSPSGQPRCVETGRGENGTLQWDGKCLSLWLDPTTAVRIVWPYGYSARLMPFTVYDNEGREVARPGDALLAAGSGPYIGEPDACGRSNYVVLVDGIQRAP